MYQLSFTEKLIAQNRADMLTFISSSSTVSTISATLCGHLFEAYAHIQLVNGGSFRVRNLDDGTISTVTFPASNHKIIYQYSDVGSLGSGDYGQPFKKKFGAVDSVYRAVTSCVFQMTVGVSHGIKVHCLDIIFNSLPLQVSKLH